MRALKTFAWVLLVCAPVVAVHAHAAERADFTGIWMSDKGDGATEIRACGENLCGYIYSIISVPDPSKPLRDNNNQKTEMRSRPLCGLQVLGALKKVAGDAYGDGWVYDPESGKSYSAEITVQGRMLAVRGYVGTKLIGRTVTWTRVSSAPKKCSPPA